MESINLMRKRLAVLFHSSRLHFIIICLVVLDCLLVVAELILDKEKCKERSQHDQEAQDSAIEITLQVIRYISLGILSIFMIELLFKMFAFGINLFVQCHPFELHKLESLDAIVIVISFLLNIFFLNGEENIESELLVLLRLWRVLRIINSMVLSVQTRAEEQIEHLKQTREELDKDLENCQLQRHKAVEQIASLRALLRKHGVDDSVIAELSDNAETTGSNSATKAHKSAKHGDNLHHHDDDCDSLI